MWEAWVQMNKRVAAAYQSPGVQMNKRAAAAYQSLGVQMNKRVAAVEHFMVRRNWFCHKSTMLHFERGDV